MMPAGVLMVRFGADDLLPGEEPASLFVDDVRHWIVVYTELLAAVEEIVGGFTESPDLLRQQERFSARLGFWRERLRQLGSDGGPERPARLRYDRGGVAN
jgi:hypothetical protein